MGIYQGLNEITRYIDGYLEDVISYEVFSRIAGANSYTLQRLFTMIVGYGIRLTSPQWKEYKIRCM
ncbi:MAG: hypothetical protein IJ704_04725 [Bacilli bacterium]|nr:hypothetical protein [Bacilli bacterium]